MDGVVIGMDHILVTYGDNSKLCIKAINLIRNGKITKGPLSYYYA